MALSFSGVAGGLTMGLTGLSSGLITSLLGHGSFAQVVAAVFYPIGFLAVVVGRAQLFTENTLYPVVLVLTEKGHLIKTARLWVLVYCGNWVGSILFAALAVKTAALQPRVREALIQLGERSVDHSFVEVLWSGVVAGWLLALVAWLVTGSHWTTGQALVVMVSLLNYGQVKLGKAADDSRGSLRRAS